VRSIVLLNMHDLISQANEVWSKAQVLTKTPSWNQEPKEAYLVDMLAEQEPLIEEYLWELVSNRKNLVSAYAIHTLFKRRSDKLADLPDDLKNRSGHISVQTGSFRSKYQYKDYVAEMIKYGEAFRKTSS